MAAHPSIASTPRLSLLLLVAVSITLLVLSTKATPATAAPAVHVIYDETLLWDNWSWSTTVDVGAASPVFAGSRSMGVTYRSGWAGLSLHTASLNTSPYTSLAFAIHPGGRPLSAVRVSLYDAGGSPITSIDPTPYAMPASGGWFAVVIPLAVLNGANRTITRVQLQESTGAAQPIFHLDNMRLIGETSASTQAYVYDDTLRWSNWSWGTGVNTAIASPVFAGSRSISVTYNRGWAGLSLHHPGFDTTPYASLAFAMRPNGKPLSAVSVALYDSSGSRIQGIDPTPYASLAGNGWHIVTIPLTALNGANRTITRVQIQEWTGGAQPTLHLDDVRFEGAGAPPPPPNDTFRVIVLPDTQRYSESYPGIFLAQTQWIASNAAALNIRFVTHVGDIVQHWDSPTEWQRADAAMDALDSAGVPYSVVPGNSDHANHDTNGSSAPYNTYFGAPRFAGQPWYAGSYRGNDNSYQLITIGSESYLFLSVDWCPSDDEIAWANSVLDGHADRRAILTTHAYLNDSAGRSGITLCGDTSYIWDGLVKGHPNLQIVVSGHMHTDDGEAYRIDLNQGGKQVHQMLANYQDYANGGDGWLRILEFDRAAGRVYVKTYSPYRNDHMTDASSQFSFAYP